MQTIEIRLQLHILKNILGSQYEQILDAQYNVRTIERSENKSRVNITGGEYRERRKNIYR